MRERAASADPDTDRAVVAPVVLLVAAILAGFVLVGFGWYRVSGTSLVAAQLSYLVSGGIGGAVLTAAAASLLRTHLTRVACAELADAVAEARDEAERLRVRLADEPGGTWVH